MGRGRFAAEQITIVKKGAESAPTAVASGTTEVPAKTHHSIAGA